MSDFSPGTDVTLLCTLKGNVDYYHSDVLVITEPSILAIVFILCSIVCQRLAM